MATTSTETDINGEQTTTTTCQHQQYAEDVDVDVDFTIPLQRQWHYAHPDMTTESDPNASRVFSVVTYNILADCFLTENGTPHCPRERYKDTQRLPQLMRELDHHLADIVCLQEVGEDLYHNHLEPALNQRGYRGSFVNYTDHPAGCATFYKTVSFELEEEQQFNYSDLLREESKEHDTKGLEEILHEASFRVAIFSRLRCRHSNKIVTLGNTHLTFSCFKRIDLIALEAILALRHLLRFAGGADQPHILCGDFNQEPHMPGCQLLQDGHLSEDNKNCLRGFPMDGDGDCKMKDGPIVDCLPYLFSHDSSHLASAFKSIVGHEPPYTQHEDDNGTGILPSEDDLLDLQRKHPWLRASTLTEPPRRMFRSKPELYGTEVYVAVLDYLWYGSDQLTCTQVFGMVDEEKIRPFVSCPNMVFPSDHMLMAAHFSFSPEFPEA